jgi:putative tricarboxylic transport membrane protein
MSDRILGAACVIVAAGMAWASKDYAAAISYEPVGPRAFPLLLSALMAAGGGWLVLRPAAHTSGLGLASVRTLGLAVVAVIAYALLFETVGFTLATAAMAVPIGIAFGGGWKHALAGGLGLGIGFYLLFDKLLDVVLPTGVLSFVLGGH